jgi:hypothetical protein
MSTFGKKALAYWDYNSKEGNRFVRSDKNLQLEILKKWYPIGEIGIIKDNGTRIKIEAHVEYVSYYLVGISFIDKNSTGSSTNPLNITLTTIERNRVIEKLLK